MADPIDARYVKKYVGARELLHDGKILPVAGRR
jgi:hypothetical protein